jgi:hypothetical protein
MNASQTKAGFAICNQGVGGEESELPEDEENDDKEQMRPAAENVHLSLFWISALLLQYPYQNQQKNIYADMKCIATRNAGCRKNNFRVR